MRNEPRTPVETLFHACREREAGAEREAYLDGACGDDADLRSRVEALLMAHDEVSGFLEVPAVTGTQEGPGSSIGPYKLLQEIGEGGMGVVYMAEQEKPVRRKVALKVIKLGMDTKQVIARFEAERQALAMMDHAHIARVLDAGSTDTGRPFFVMELVRGVPINEYCDTHKLSTDERLGLFVAVCRAVQHAHQKGIIHRDLKPTNVLVTSHDGTPVPKIIDFGVAKATNQRLTERTLFTEFHQIIGTPEYMSPEQAEMSGLDVDTRSDIYALGVLLYQLLTGTTPVDPTELRTAAFDEMTRMIREDEPPAPSTRVSKLGADGAKIAEHRGSDTGSLSRLFRGDLDWIVMKALEKDRTRRYETASAFAEDVVRHLEDRPVEAGRPGAGYRMAKFAHRNRKAVVAALVLGMVVALGLMGTTAGFLRARSEADRSSAMSASLQDVLAMSGATRASDAEHARAVLATVREVFGEDHATYAAVLDTLSKRLYDAGDFDAAADLSRESLAVWKKAYGDEHPNVAVTLARLGETLRAQGDDEEAEGLLREALAIFERSSDLEGATGLAGFDARIALSSLLGNRGEFTEADELLGEALEVLRSSPTPAHFRIMGVLEQRLALELNRPDGDARETLRALREESLAFYPDDSPLVAVWAMAYGKQLALHGEEEAAMPFLREAIERFRTDPDASRLHFFGAADTLFQILRSRTDEESVLEANGLLRDILRIGGGFLDADTLASTTIFYASRLMERGRFGEALEALLDAHQSLRDAGRSVDELEGLRDNMTFMTFKTVTRPGLPAEVYARAREAAERALADEPEHAAMMVALGAALYRQGELTRAAELLDQVSVPLSRTRGGLAKNMSPADHAFRAMVHARLGHDAIARAELETLRAIIADRGGSEERPALLREVEAVVESTPSSNEDG